MRGLAFWRRGDRASVGAARPFIPRIVHQFWHEPPPPDDVSALTETWRSFHPGWEYRLWDDRSAEAFLASEFGANAARCFRAATIASMRSDISRTAALVAIGGVYADADTRCLAPLDDLVATGDPCILYYADNTIGAGAAAWAAGGEFPPAGSIAPDAKAVCRIIRMGLMISAPRHPLMIRLLDRILDNITREVWNNIWPASGPGALTRLWSELSETDRGPVRLLDTKTAYSYHRNIHDLAYRADHWSKQQRRQKVIDFARADAVART